MATQFSIHDNRPWKSKFFTIWGGQAPIGLMIAGPVADRVGIQAWFLLGGILCVVTGIAWLFIPAVMGIEEQHSIVPDPQGGVVPVSP